MRILRREKVFVHTHFVTDCEYLPQDRAREVRRHLAPVLEQLGIVFGIHFGAGRADRGVHIILECIPGEAKMQRIEKELKAVIRDIPRRPRHTRVTVMERRDRPPAAEG